MYFFSHIPKTAGTTLGFILDYMFDRKSFWDYGEKYRDDPDLLMHIASLSRGGYLSLVGGHITASSYKSLLQSESAIFLYTARRPYDHFISKLNHDLNCAIAASPKEIKMRIASLSKKDSATNIAHVSLKDVSEIFLIDKIFGNKSMKNYLRSYIEADGVVPGIRSYPFFSDILDESLQFFVWKEYQYGVRLARKDPAQEESTRSVGVQWLMPIFNSGLNREYAVLLAPDEKERIVEFLAESSNYYSSIRKQYSESLAAARREGFIYRPLPVVKFRHVR